MKWDIFCKVIDNFGDIGVCWRLACDLAARGQTVRLWVDDASALKWMAPAGCAGVEVRAWTQPLDLAGVTPGEVLIESFGCEIAPDFIAVYARQSVVSALKHTWINLEYLSAESFAERSHGLPSPVMDGPGKGLTKHFFYPGFTDGTGGLIREADQLQRQADFDRVARLNQLGIPLDPSQHERLISLFCYEPRALADLLHQLENDATPTRLLLTAGRAADAFMAALALKNSKETWPEGAYRKRKQLSFSYLPRLSQLQYDELLWACDLNFVRGEDSLVRAIWAGKPFIWQIYPQHDDAHHTKLDAFLELMNAPPSLRRFSWAWNGVAWNGDAQNGVGPGDVATLEALDLPAWGAASRDLRHQLLGQTDLASQLIAFCAGKHAG